MKDSYRHIEEILLKEEEKHRLIYIGIIADKDEWKRITRLTEDTFNCRDTSFIDIKIHLLDFFYSSILHYREFIKKGKASNPHLKQHHFKKTEAYVLTMSKAAKAELDKELKTPAGISFAWLFSNRIYDGIYAHFCRSASVFRMPQETDEFFFGETKKKYPLTINQVVGQLEADDLSFWKICARYMKYLSNKAVNYFLQRSDNYGFSDLIKDQTWEDAYAVLRKRFVEKTGNIPKFKNGSDFRNYLMKVCKLQAHNSQRKYAQKESYIDDWVQKQQNSEDEEAIDIPSFEGEEYENPAFDYEESYELDINTDNPYEVANAVSLILLNSSHPLFLPLIDGIEDKVELLIDKAVNEMSYNEIVSDRYEGKKLSEEDFRRLNVKARKDFERVRKTLCERLKNLVNRKVKKGRHNYVFSPIYNKTSEL